MNDIEKQKIISRQDEFRNILNERRDELTGFIEDDMNFQGIISTILLDVVTSGIDERSALSSSIIIGIALGRLLEKGELDFSDYPTPEQIASAFVNQMREIADEKS